MLSSKSLRKYMASVSEVALLTTGSEAEKGILTCLTHPEYCSTYGKTNRICGKEVLQGVRW